MLPTKAFTAVAVANMQPRRMLFPCFSGSINIEIRYPMSNGERREPIANKTLPQAITAVSPGEIIFTIIFHSFGVFFFPMDLANSSFHFLFRSSVADCQVFSFESGTKSPSSGARLLPVFMTSFIHWNRRRGNKTQFLSRVIGRGVLPVTIRCHDSKPLVK